MTLIQGGEHLRYLYFRILSSLPRVFMGETVMKVKRSNGNPLIYLASRSEPGLVFRRACRHVEVFASSGPTPMRVQQNWLVARKSIVALQRLKTSYEPQA